MIYSILEGNNYEYLDRFGVNQTDLLSSTTKKEHSVVREETDEEWTGSRGSQVREGSEDCGPSESEENSGETSRSVQTRSSLW